MAIDLKSFAQLSAFACLLLASCTVGPDFKAPRPGAPSSWFRAPPADTVAQAVENEPVDASWWKLLGDPELDALVARIATQNPDVLTATARLDESRAELGVTAADLFPQLNGNALYNREKESDKGVVSLFSGSSSGGSNGGASGSGGSGGSGAASSMGIPSTMKSPAFNLYQYGFDASWEIDLWGRVRRSAEAADAQLQASAEARRAAQLSAVAELVSDYVQLRGTQASLVTTRKNLAAAREYANLARERYKGGLGTDLDVANAQSQAASAAAQLPQLEQQASKLMNAIALLLAQPPGALEAELEPEKAIPPIPRQVPVGLPSELARRRPDVRQAEDQLHAATAQIGVAKADFFPRITLMGNGELQSLQFNTLNTWAAHTYTVGPSISLPIFEGGRLVSTLELRKAAEREAAVQYRKTLLTAFHEVDNALTAFRAEQERNKQLLIAANENRKALDLAGKRYRQGLSTFLDVLTAERSLLETELQAIQSQETESVNMVQLYKALGGGWEEEFPEK